MFIMASFSRSNVNDLAFSKGSVDRSSYNLNQHVNITPVLGKFHPVRCTRLMPKEIVSGSVNPELQLEKVISPQIGRTRLDTHSFVVPFRRLARDFKQKLEQENFSADRSMWSIGAFNYLGLYYDVWRSLFFFRQKGDLITSWSMDIDAAVRSLSADRIKFLLDHSFIYEKPVGSSSVYASSFEQVLDLLSGGLAFPFEHFLESYMLHIALIYYLYGYSVLETLSLNYPRDFYVQEFNRLFERINLSGFNPIDIIRFILQPYFGTNSNFDYLGYPILRQYDNYSFLSFADIQGVSWTSLPISFDGQFYSFGVTSKIGLLCSYLLSFFVAPLGGDVTYTDGAALSLTLNTKIMNPFALYDGIEVDYVNSGVGRFYDFVAQLPYKYVSDFPLRAAYCCWFDRMRDWHIENRSMCLDPDNWTCSTLFNFSPTTTSQGFANIYVNALVATTNVQMLYSVPYALCVPRTRFYADDALTTVKTDDKFRHVYAPIFELDEIAGAVDTNSDDKLNQIEQLYIDTISVAFPSGGLFRQSVLSDSNIRALRNDLCVAKRAGMLERWLARNYFTPDNYNGYINAHFDVDVSDMDMLISKYIGGSEQLVSGEQQVADISTSETERGTRTFSGGVSSNSDFSYQTTDYMYLVSFVSLVPLVEYDALNPAILETDFHDLPSPEYANDTRIEARLSEFLRGFPLAHDVFGFVPRYYFDRVTLDAARGRYLTDYRAYSWFRDWYNMTFKAGSQYGGHGFDLSPYSLRINLPLDSFLGLAPWDSIAFGGVSLPLSVNVPLSAAVEVI